MDINMRIDISCHARETFTPSIISFFTVIIYHFAGMMCDIHCSMGGILSIGNIIPESNLVGIINIIPEASIAATCVFVKVEISNPRDNDTKMKRRDTIISQNRLPAIGTCKT